MYAEVFGFTATSPGVEEAAKWVQWAQYGIMQGASKNDPTIRYNLDQFWKTKAQVYQVEGEQGRKQLEYLDTWAHGLWSALESGRVVSAAPSFAAWIGSSVTGSTPARPAAAQAMTNLQTLTTAQVRAAEASGSTAALAIAAQGRQAASTAAASKAAADAWWKAPGPLGVPVIVWAAAAAAGILLITYRGKA
jgi:hypothetical protein